MIIAPCEHGIEVIWDALPKRGYRPWVTWVHCLGCIVEAIVIRAFEEISDTIGVSEINGNDTVNLVVFNQGRNCSLFAKTKPNPNQVARMAKSGVRLLACGKPTDVVFCRSQRITITGLYSSISRTS